MTVEDRPVQPPLPPLSSLPRPALNRRPFIRNIDAARYLEDFFLSAIVSIVVVRLFLSATGYPKIGGNGFHIAHMLWGGLLLVVALLLAIGFLTAATQRLAALAGGLGFGLFIDEVGKVITVDNNYLFQPAFAVIYVVFVIVYVLAVSIGRRRPYSRLEYRINALEIAKDALVWEADASERAQAQRFIAQLGATDPTYLALAELLRVAPPADPRPPRFTRAGVFLAQSARAVFTNIFVVRVALVCFAAIMMLNFVQVSTTVVRYGTAFDTHLGVPSRVFGWGAASSVTLATMLLLVGMLRWPRSRYSAYRLFRYAVLTTIFLVQVFSFYQKQLVGLVDLLLSIAILKAVDAALQREERKRAGPPGDSHVQMRFHRGGLGT